MRRTKRTLEMEHKVVKFIMEHPLSTAEEIFKATGSGVCGHRFLRSKKYEGRTVWRLNHPKWKRYLANCANECEDQPILLVNKPQQKGPMKRIPAQIKKHFPQVTEVKDAKNTIEVTVLPEDSVTGRKKDPHGCALVKACMRTRIADAAIIGLAYSWLIKDNVATRYKTSVGVSREITSFDRHQDFAPGKGYKLSKVPPKSRLGVKYWPKTGPHKTSRNDTQKVHHTANVRQIKQYSDV